MNSEYYSPIFNLNLDQLCFFFSQANKRGIVRGTDRFEAWLLYWDIEIERDNSGFF